jgi:hypothetical protein
MFFASPQLLLLFAAAAAAIAFAGCTFVHFQAM